MKRGVVIRSAFRLARRYWFSEEKATAWGLLLAVVLLNLGLVYLSVLLNYWQASFFQLIQDYDRAAFIDSLIRFALLSLFFVVLRGYQTYARMRLHICWRRWLTERFVGDWLSLKTYYRIQLFAGQAADNPDQRISEDVELFVALTLRLSIDLLRDLVSMGSFVVILWDLSGVVYLPLGTTAIPVYGYLVWAALLYAGAGTYWTLRLGRPLIQLDYNQQKYEADFRYNLIRVRDNAESIALYQGEQQERVALLGWFQAIVDNYGRIITVRRTLAWLTAGYSRVSVLFAFFAAAPRYFSRQIQFGQLFQIVDAYHQVQEGLSFIVDSFTRLAQWRAVVNRLNSFLVCMEMVRDEAGRETVRRVSHRSERLAIRQLSVFRPDGHCLIRGMELDIAAGQRILVTGPSGCGKSTLLRTVAGIWPCADGELRFPAGQRMLYVPQRAYMPIDSLERVLSYPDCPDSRDVDRKRELLQILRLTQLADKLALVQDWGQVLSLGEQQRIAFVRILLAQPAWLFLDEATSALDEATERRVYQLLLTQLPRTAVVSIGHRSTLQGYHTGRLALDGEGGWNWRD